MRVAIHVGTARAADAGIEPIQIYSIRHRTNIFGVASLQDLAANKVWRGLRWRQCQSLGLPVVGNRSPGVYQILEIPGRTSRSPQLAFLQLGFGIFTSALAGVGTLL